MTKQKKPYIPPKVEFHSAGSDAYNRFHALLDEEMKQAAEFQKKALPIHPMNHSQQKNVGRYNHVSAANR